MSDVPNINDMLKLYTKKELWERIQHHIKKIDNLQHQLNHQKAMWNELKEWVENKSIEIKRVNAMNEEMARIRDYIDMVYKECYIKMQELEKGEKDE